ncbi:MAG TPA: SHOCT domain-containing protein [Thermomicrobiaceae bacterium]|nr:SHOCT domain-containing protein [Thermomicrobiaceae bacterium]
MILVAILIAIVVWLLVRQRAVAPGTRSGADNALAVLRERFARGEISAEEYAERRRVLESR